MSETRANAFMALYWGDYLRDTSHLDMAQHGAYLLLIGHYWCTGRPLPDDDAQLFRIARAHSIPAWRKIRPVLEPFFTIENGTWRHRRVDRELAIAMTKTAARSALGRAAAESRWKGRRAYALGNADGMPDAMRTASGPHTQPQPQRENYLVPWNARMISFERYQVWLPEWGPKPGHPGCQVPQSILARFPNLSAPAAIPESGPDGFTIPSFLDRSKR